MIDIQRAWTLLDCPDQRSFNIGSALLIIHVKRYQLLILRREIGCFSDIQLGLGPLVLISFLHFPSLVMFQFSIIFVQKFLSLKKKSREFGGIVVFKW